MGQTAGRLCIALRWDCRGIVACGQRLAAELDRELKSGVDCSKLKRFGGGKIQDGFSFILEEMRGIIACAITLHCFASDGVHFFESSTLTLC